MPVLAPAHHSVQIRGDQVPGPTDIPSNHRQNLSHRVDLHVSLGGLATGDGCNAAIAEIMRRSSREALAGAFCVNWIV